MSYELCTKKQFDQNRFVYKEDFVYKVGEDGDFTRQELKPGLRQRKGMQLK